MYRLLLFIVLLSFTFSLSAQSKIVKEVVVKQIEGTQVVYSFNENNSDVVFRVNNSSLNAMEISWDVKVFYSETESVMIHKTAFIDAKENKQITISRELSSDELASKKKRIQSIEVHNFTYKGIK
ncbi:MAG: hypothetical protein JXR60_04330 [Bacteroidales bacterium]|nr:hypothetical protein [Bacteroidales bacterium]